MVKFTTCHAEHVKYIKPLPVQMDEYKGLLSPAGQEAIGRSMGLTGWHDYRCIGMAGVFQHWPGRAEAWILLGEGAAPHVREIVRKARFVLDTYPAKRIEIYVKVQNAEGQRIARLLGFGKPEGVARSYHPDGSDMFVYARIRE